MSEGCEAKPWPLPSHTAPEAPNDATKTHSIALKENTKAELNSPTKAVAKKQGETCAMSIDSKVTKPSASGGLESGESNRVDSPATIKAVQKSKDTQDGSKFAMASSANSDVALPTSGKELKKAGEHLPENSALQASARPIVIPIQKVFAPVHEGL